jgi:hypothetical protein
MADEINYADLVKQAEKAVASVKDPELRRVAFEKVLDDLLAIGSGSKEVPHKKSTGKTAPKAQPNRNARGGPTAYIQELADDGFFKKRKTIAEIKAELENRGHHIPLTSLSGPLQNLCKGKVLRRQKTSEPGSRRTYSYSEW